MNTTERRASRRSKPQKDEHKTAVLSYTAEYKKTIRCKARGRAKLSQGFLLRDLSSPKTSSTLGQTR